MVVGPEAPLVAGLADALADAACRCFGPTAAAARLEGSKSFCKEIMVAAGIPTAAYHPWSPTWTRAWRLSTAIPTVIKADGLAAGKGVIIAEDEAAARQALTELLVEHRFDTDPGRGGGAPERRGAVAAGRLRRRDRALPLASAQDYKRIFDGNRGPNTGGMGSYSPVPAVGFDQARAISAAGPPARAGRAEPPRHRVPRRPLRRADDDRGGTQGAGVQRAVRRPGDADDPAPAAQRSAGADGRRVRGGGLEGVGLDWDPRSRRSRSCWPAPAIPPARTRAM